MFLGGFSGSYPFSAANPADFCLFKTNKYSQIPYGPHHLAEWKRRRRFISEMKAAGWVSIKRKGSKERSERFAAEKRISHLSWPQTLKSKKGKRGLNIHLVQTPYRYTTQLY